MVSLRDAGALLYERGDILSPLSCYMMAARKYGLERTMPKTSLRGSAFFMCSVCKIGSS